MTFDRQNWTDPDAAKLAYDQALRDVRKELREERNFDPSTYNVWSRVTNAVDRVEASG